MKIPEQITLLRTRSGMSQGELAEKLDVSRQSVSKWETGASIPEIDKLVKISNIFGVTLDELVTGEAPEPAPEVTQEVKRSLTLRQLLGAALLILAALCIAVTVLFAHRFGLHTSEGVLLSAWFALLGLISLKPRATRLRLYACGAYALSALMLLLLSLLGLHRLQGMGVFLFIGLTLVCWAIFTVRK